jgi:hypothetical protein
VPHSAKDTSRANTFAFRTPPWYASVLKEAGFDVLSVANNHSMDFFEQGFEDTIANIEASGMKAVGRKGEILVVEAQGQRVAFIAFSTFDVHNTVNDLESAIALVETAQQQADMVVVSFHAGKEGTDAVYTRDQEEFFYSENRGNVVRFSHTMVDHGADLVLGHGPHAPRALELYNNEVTTGAQPGMADEALDVFISYSRQDEALKNELVDYHLKRLQREGKINTWQDRDIEAGAEWAQAIKTNLEKADIVLLLVTHYFLASDYCYETEMQRAVQRHEEGTARVIPIILRPCSWEESEFKKLQVLPTDGKPVTSWTNPEEAFLIVEKGIRQVVDALNGEPIRAVEAARAQATAAINRQQEATERKIPFEVTRYGIDDLDRAIADSAAHGFVKVLTVPGKDRILGVTIVGEHAGELLAEYVLAMKHGLGLNKMLGTIHTYPTMGEANKYVAGEWKRAHAPQALLAWVQRFHAWRRGG